MANVNFKSISFPLFASIVVAYTTLCGCLWHIGYWSTFKFNFLEFASISDLFKSTLYPLLSSIWIFAALSFFTLGLTSVPAILVLRKSLEPQSSNYTELPNWVVALLALLFSTTGFAFSGLFFRNKDNWVLLSVTIAGVLTCVIYGIGALKKYMRDDVLRLGTIFILSVVPSLNFGIAKKLSLQTKYMIRYQAVQHISTTDSLLNRALPDAAYLATTNNFHFFYVPEQIIVVKSSDIHSLVLEDTLNKENYFRWRDDSIVIRKNPYLP
jgi:hypothetical protein